jgi:hypothetical protein
MGGELGVFGPLGAVTLGFDCGMGGGDTLHFGSPEAPLSGA